MLVGVDGCKGGWIAVAAREPEADPEIYVFQTFLALVDRFDADAIIAVDMPIGLPDRAGHGGRGPESLVRPRLGARQSSVFSVPSRSAVFAERGPFADDVARYAAHRRASDIARLTSDPPKAISIQAFGLFHRIRELDELLRADAALAARTFESHPELAFTVLNGRRHMSTPKKIRGVVNPLGMEERRSLLEAHGLRRTALLTPPRGAAADDLLDAAAMLLVAGRIRAGEARPNPDPPGRDAYGLPVAIWA